MDCSPVFDNVKYEKAKAVERYNRYRKISKILQVLEVVVAVALISWSSTRLPGVLRLSGGALVEFGRYVCNPLVVFLIGNAIVAVLFLCRRVHEPAAEGEDSDSAASDDIYGEYVLHSYRKPFVPVEVRRAPLPTPVAEDFGGGDAAEEKQIVCVFEENKAEQCDAVAEAIETATRQIERFQRTQSVKLKREIAAAGKPSPAELRRSEMVKIGGRRREEGIETVSVDRVEKLSDEEFNMAIEAYIKRHRELISSGDEITTKPSG